MKICRWMADQGVSESKREKRTGIGSLQNQEVELESAILL